MWAIIGVEMCAIRIPNTQTITLTSFFFFFFEKLTLTSYVCCNALELSKMFNISVLLNGLKREAN